MSYVTIGSYIPLLVLSFFGALILYGHRRETEAEIRAVRAWAVALILWGFARLVLLALFVFTSVSEAHVESQFSAWYVLLSLGHIGLGVYLFQSRKRAE